MRTRKGALDPVAGFFGKSWGRKDGVLPPDPALPNDPTLPALPLHTDWAWRPAPWTSDRLVDGGAARSGGEIAPGAKLFHDDRAADILLDWGAFDRPPFALRIAVGSFAGSFLSLALDLPADGVRGLRRRQILRAETRVDAPGTPEIYLRLNIRHGANTERLPQSIQPNLPQVAEFDLFHSPFFEGAVEAVWLDLIVTAPTPGRIVIGDLVLSRRPRPEI
ncbi:DUF6478 family protein [Palleronia sp. KMU-117]|uniref:DUF6478 family protein n=1 Tax=Palleronia sp. KMU-117 TaxID=3434108 RepID=UPI003D757D56